MKYQILGQSDLKVSKICLGTMTFGQQNTEADGHEQMDYALDQGINFFDTAEMYSVPGRKETQGSTERILGSWFKKTGNRNKVILASKITGPSRGLSHVSPTLDYSPARILSAIEGSLGRLQTDIIDIYQLHWPERKTNYFGQLNYPIVSDDEWQDNFHSVISTMEKLKGEGKIRYWGMSNETPWGLMKATFVADQHNMMRPLTVQNPYNLLNRTFEIGMSEVSMRENVPLLAYSPMAFGLLSGKYHKGSDSPNDRINQFPTLSRYNGASTRLMAQKYLDLAAEFNLSPAVMSLAFVHQQPFVGSTIIGATSMAQLRENVSSINVEISDALISRINELHMAHSNPAP